MGKEGGILSTLSSLIRRTAEQSPSSDSSQAETRQQRKEREAAERQMYKIIVEGLQAISDLADDAKEVHQSTKAELMQQLPELTKQFLAQGWVEFNHRVFINARNKRFIALYTQAQTEAKAAGKDLPHLASEYYVQDSSGGLLYGFGATDGYSGPVHGINYNTLGFHTWGLIGKKYFSVFHQDFANKVKTQFLMK